MPSNSSTQKNSDASKAPKRAADELDAKALDKVTGGMKVTGITGLKGTKTADPCEGGE
jgi:hypothetical protein